MYIESKTSLESKEHFELFNIKGGNAIIRGATKCF